MINEPYIKQKVHNMIKKRINDAKKGVIQVNGNYSVILGDLYGMLQHMFKKEVTGALRKGEFYSKESLSRRFFNCSASDLRIESVISQVLSYTWLTILGFISLTTRMTSFIMT